MAHVAFADPFCHDLRARASHAVRATGSAVHNGGSYVTIEGPAFGTRAESHLYRSWGASVVGMTAIPEAKLAREAELCYALVAAVTDYDSWNTGVSEVDAARVFEVLKQNVAAAQQGVREVVKGLDSAGSPCDCNLALDTGLVTAPGAIGAEAKVRLGPILSRRLGMVPA